MAFRTDACFMTLQPVLPPPKQNKLFCTRKSTFTKTGKKQNISRIQKELYEKELQQNLKLTSALMVPDKLFHYTHICVM